MTPAPASECPSARWSKSFPSTTKPLPATSPMDSSTWMCRSKPLSARTRAPQDPSAIIKPPSNSPKTETKPLPITTDSPQPKPTPPQKKEAGPPTPKPSKPQRKSNAQQRRKRAQVGTASQAVQADQQ